MDLSEVLDWDILHSIETTFASTLKMLFNCRYETTLLKRLSLFLTNVGLDFQQYLQFQLAYDPDMK